MTMKKKVLFCLAALGTASMLFGFDSAETAESVLEKMQTAADESSAFGVEMDMDMNMDISLDIDDGTTSSSIGVGASGNFDINASNDPAAASMDGKLDLSILGQDQSMIMKMYEVSSEDGKFDIYIYNENSVSGEEGTWTHQSSDVSSLDSLTDQATDIDYSEWGLDFELASEPVTVDGKECYLLNTVIDSASLETMMNKIQEISGQSIASDENLSMIQSMLDGLKLKFEYYVDTATYFPVKFHIDLNDSDLSALSQYLAMAMGEMAEGSSVDLVLNDFSIDASMAYGDAKEITVPEEALAAPDAGDVLGEVENTLGGITG